MRLETKLTGAVSATRRSQSPGEVRSALVTRPRVAGGFTLRWSTRRDHPPPHRVLPALSHKYAQLKCARVQRDLEQNQAVARWQTSYIRMWTIMSAASPLAKEETWEYALPPLDVPMAAIVISLDGAMIPMAASAGYREVMRRCAVVLRHDGERQHSSTWPPHPSMASRRKFLEAPGREIARAKQSYPNALYLGADGATATLDISRAAHQRQLIDFFHATSTSASSHRRRRIRSGATRSDGPTGSTLAATLQARAARHSIS